MRTSTRRTAQRWAVGAAVIAAGVGGAVVAVPAAAAPAGDSATGTAATERLCSERVPVLQGRIERALDRIAGDEDTPGSLAYLQERIARAEERGGTAVVDLLEIRLENRQALQGLLEQRRDDLATWVETYCGSTE